MCLWACLNCCLTLFRLPAVLLIPLRPLGSSFISPEARSISVWGQTTSLCLLVLTGALSGPQTSEVISYWPRELPDHTNTPNSHGVFALTCFLTLLKALYYSVSIPQTLVDPVPPPRASPLAVSSPSQGCKWHTQHQCSLSMCYSDSGEERTHALLPSQQTHCKSIY